MANVSNQRKFIPSCNQSCMTRPTIIDSNLAECNPLLHYYPFEVHLGRCIGSCNTLDDASDRICVPNKTKDIFILTKRINYCNGTRNHKHLTRKRTLND